MSKSVGIVAEYNPFHTGHRYQIDFLKKNGFDTIVVAMSGSCVQRGMPALLNKHSWMKKDMEFHPQGLHRFQKVKLGREYTTVGMKNFEKLCESDKVWHGFC